MPTTYYRPNLPEKSPAKQYIYTQSLSPDEQRLFRLYGKLPNKKDLLQNKLKERKYFDSGDYALSKAGNATLMTAELMEALVDHSSGNYRLLMNMGGELLAYGMANEVAQLDEQCYLELYQSKSSRPALRKKVKA